MIGGKRKTIGVFLCKAYSLFDNAVFSALAEQSRKLDYDIVVFTSVGYFASRNDYDAQERGMFAFAPVERLDGIIVAPDTYELEGFRDELRQEIQRRARCPVVALRHRSKEIACVYTDEDRAFRPLIRHMLEEHGLKRVAFLAGYEGHPDSERRLQVFREEMAAHGLTVDGEKDICHGNMWLNCGPQAYEYFFGEGRERPEAVACANDYMAIGLIRTLMEHGIRVPQDVVVTGFDNVPSVAMDEPTMTTVEQDFAGMVAAALEKLDREIRLGDADWAERIPMGGKLIIGESCGCGDRGKDYYLRAALDKGRQIETMNTREVSMTYLTIELNACEDLQDMHRVLIDKLDDTPIMRDYYLCLFTEEGGTAAEPVFAKETTDRVCLVHAVRDHQDHGMPMITFDRKMLLPEMAERADEPQVFYLMLLHQRENAYGYAMFHYEDGELPSVYFQHWNVIISGALSNMHKQNELRMLYEERRLSSITDVMTRLLNRRGLEEQLTPVWHHLCARGESVAFVSFDLDGLKKINDTYGHQAGDYAIRLVAEAIRRSAPKEALAARMGGDEFLTVLPRAAQAGADRFVADFRRALDRLNREEDRAFRAEASTGAAVFRLDNLTTIETCIQKSDEIMYRQKEERHVRRE